MADAGIIINLVDVVKTYGGFTALKKLNLQIKRGEFFTPAGAFGVRQDDDPASDLGLRAPRWRPGRDQWRQCRRQAAL